jgi:hypothetical protein
LIEIIILIARIILLIAGGLDAIEATSKVAGEGGVGSATLWAKLPKKWK